MTRSDCQDSSAATSHGDPSAGPTPISKPHTKDTKPNRKVPMTPDLNAYDAIQPDAAECAQIIGMPLSRPRSPVQCLANNARILTGKRTEDMSRVRTARKEAGFEDLRERIRRLNIHTSTSQPSQGGSESVTADRDQTGSGSLEITDTSPEVEHNHVDAPVRPRTVDDDVSHTGSLGRTPK